ITQDHILGGTIVDPSQSLAVLQKQLDDGNLESTADEIAEYQVSFQLSKGRGMPIGVSLADSSGTVGSRLLTSWESLDGSRTGRPLLRAIHASDALIITVDGSAGPVHLENVFAQVDRFLHLLEGARGRWTQVGGLPVFLVLTKCDLLVQQGDTFP